MPEFSIKPLCMEFGPQLFAKQQHFSHTCAMATVIELGYYTSTLVGFYAYLIPSIGAEIKEICIAHHWCHHQLKKTMFGYEVDMSDGQWREFRNSLPLLIGTAVLGVVLHAMFRRWRENTKSFSLSSTHFHLVLGAVILFVQHGWHTVIVFSLIIGAFLVTKVTRHFRGAYFLVVVYLYAIAVLLLKESYRVQHFPQWHFLRVLFDKQYSGLYSWHVPANFLVLRIVSFMLDFHWASTALCASKKEKAQHEDSKEGGGDNANTCPVREGCKFKSLTDGVVSDHLAIHQYSLVNFLSYCVYAPLYIAGPVVTFNAYVHYSTSPQRSERVLPYALRWVAAFFLMEFGISYFPFFAVINTGTCDAQRIMLSVSHCFRYLFPFCRALPDIERSPVGYPGVLYSKAHVAQISAHLALLPAVGAGRRCVAPGEPEKVHEQQPVYRPVLERLACLLQPVAREVCCCSAV